MRGNRPAELIIGSVQLGLPYGAANRTGKPSRETALRLVRRAADAGVRGFDTARTYGDAEDRLGEALASRKGICTITKLSSLSDLSPNAGEVEVVAAVDASIAQSLAALKRERLDCLLLHRAHHLTAWNGAVWRRLLEHQVQNLISTLGLSVQSPAEALAALDIPQVHHLQFAFNILDWRWFDAGVIDSLAKRPDVTVHVRSVFLQGLLVSNDSKAWPLVAGVDADALMAWLEKASQDFHRHSVADLCLSYVRAQDWIDGVVIGMETEDQLEANLGLIARPPLTVEACASIEDTRPRVPAQLLDPAQWFAK